MDMPTKRFMSFAEHPGSSEIQTIMALLDISGSMNLCDYLPTRLKAGVGALCSMAERMAVRYSEDRVGIVVFGSHATVIHPPVPVGANLAILKNVAANIQTDGLTNIRAGLEVAGACMGLSDFGIRAGSAFKWLSRLVFEPVSAKPAVPATSGLNRIIILSDGAHNVGRSPLPTAEALKRSGVCIDAIGIGGSPQDVDPRLPQMASSNPDGSPRYCFIGDVLQLVRKFEDLGNRIRPV